MNLFKELGLSRLTAAGLKEAAYTEPTEIQVRTIPHILDGADVMASAQTGSGKTAAFALPIIEILEEPGPRPRALVLVPTRELAVQVAEQFKLFGKQAKLRTVTLYGGTGFQSQGKALQRGADIIVATPGRLLDFMGRGMVDLAAVETLVLDEADRLMDMGFMPQIRKVVAKLRRDRQTVMFSATFEGAVAVIARDYLINPVVIRVNEEKIEPKDIAQKMHYVTEFGKDALLLRLLSEKNEGSVIVFTKTRRRATWVTTKLRAAGVAAEEIHGDISQIQRERTLSRFRTSSFRVLVATDVAARGLDIPAIGFVINYDLPEAAEDYVHRIGRTGRAGRAGVAESFVAEGERYLVRDIEKLIGKIEGSQTENFKKPATAARRRFRSSARRATGW